jgi:NADH-quinone oxidoreductase subunit A
MPQQYLFDYSAVALAALLGVVLVASLLLLSRILAPRRYEAQKGVTYECGVLPLGNDRWMQFHVRYYLYAILFVIFEVEAVFLFPWAVVLKPLGEVALIEMTIFLSILIFGLAYAWRKGVLEWEQ